MFQEQYESDKKELEKKINSMQDEINFLYQENVKMATLLNEIWQKLKSEIL